MINETMTPQQRITATGLSIEGYEDEKKLIACIALMIDQLRAEQHLPYGIAFLKTIPQGERAKQYFDILANGEFRAEVVHSKMDKKNRNKWIDDEHCDFRLGKINVVFNVCILTAGYDFPLSKYMWFLKQPTLNDFQQMIGRNTRLHPKKDKFLIYDFVGAIAKLELDAEDLFSPVVLAKFPKEKGDKIEIQCPQCTGKFKASVRPNPSKYGINQAGNFVDLTGKELEPSLPAHFARSCQVEKPLKPYPKSNADYQYGCGYRFLAKDCPACGAECDITASYCECGQELINVNRDIQNAMATISGEKLRLKVDRHVGGNKLKQGNYGDYYAVGFYLDGLKGEIDAEGNEKPGVWLSVKPHEIAAFKQNIPTHLTVKWSAKKSKWQVLNKVGDFINGN